MCYGDISDTLFQGVRRLRRLDKRTARIESYFNAAVGTGHDIFAPCLLERRKRMGRRQITGRRQFYHFL
jgi:hypothetical protein